MLTAKGKGEERRGSGGRQGRGGCTCLCQPGCLLGKTLQTFQIEAEAGSGLHLHPGLQLDGQTDRQTAPGPAASPTELPVADFGDWERGYPRLQPNYFSYIYRSP